MGLGAACASAAAWTGVNGGVNLNPGGRVGSGTMFELGFMSALGKRVIFTEEPLGMSVSFPCEVGLGT